MIRLLASLLALAAAHAGGDHRRLLPEFERHRLDSGLEVVFVERAALPLTTFALYLRGGLALEDRDTFRHLPVAMGCLWMGCGDLDEDGVRDAAERIGGAFGSYVDLEYARVHLSCLAAHRERGLDLLMQALTAARLDGAVVAREAEQERRLLGMREHQGEARAQLAVLRQLYGDHPYVDAHRLTDESGALTRLDAAAARRAVARQLQPRLGTLFVIGPRDAAFETRARERLTSWRPPPVDVELPPPPTRAADAADARLLRIDQPDRQQVYVQVCGVGAAPDDPHYAATLLVQTALGAGFTSPMLAELRVRRGLVYALGFRQPELSFPPPFTVLTRTQPEHVREVLGVIHDLLHRAADGDLLTEDHLVTARNLWRTELAAAIETHVGLADVLHAGLRTHGDLRAAERVVEQMATVDLAALRRAAAAFDPDHTVVALVGDPTALADIRWP